jgi:hypothetical protein
MTSSQKTLKWFNDHVEEKRTYPLISDIQSKLEEAVETDIDIAKKLKELPIMKRKNSLISSVELFSSIRLIREVINSIEK